MAASLSPRAISVSSMSKTYGLPGCGSAGSPAATPSSREALLAAKEQILICGSTLDEEIAPPCARRARADPAADPREGRAPPRDRPPVDRGPGGVRVGRAARRGGLLPARPRRAGSTTTASTTRCCASTAPTSGPGTGSARTAGRFGSASPGRRPRSSSAASPDCWPPPRTPVRLAPLARGLQIRLDLALGQVGEVAERDVRVDQVQAPGRGPGSRSASAPRRPGRSGARRRRRPTSSRRCRRPTRIHGVVTAGPRDPDRLGAGADRGPRRERLARVDGAQQGRCRLRAPRGWCRGRRPSPRPGR